MGFGDKHFEIDVKSSRSQDGHSTEGTISSGVLVFVYDAGTKDLATLYSDAARTSLTNPISRSQFDTDGRIDFYCAASSVDIFLADDNGNTGFYPSVSVNDHSLALDVDGADKCLVVPFSDATSAETDSGLDLPDKVKVYDINVEVTTVDAGETLDVGLLSSESGGDTDGLLAGVSLASTGVVKPFEITDGSGEDYISAVRWGALMGLGSTGTDTANDFGQPGGSGHVIDGTAKSVVYQASAGSDTGDGYIYIHFRHLR